MLSMVSWCNLVITDCFMRLIMYQIKFVCLDDLVAVDHSIASLRKYGHLVMQRSY